MEHLDIVRAPSIDGMEAFTMESLKTNLVPASTEDQLKRWSLDIVNRVNGRDFQTAITLYASPDYTYETTEDNVQVLRLNAADMLKFREFYFQKLSPGLWAEVVSTEVQIDRRAGLATVWVGLVVKNDIRGVLRERMNLFFWRLEKGGRWVWWKEHTSAGFAGITG